MDYYSETAICFIVSNGYNKHTLISIDMDIPQIAGRIRTKSNPFRNKIVHIFNPKVMNYYLPFAEMKQKIAKELTAAEERIQVLNESKLGEVARKQQDDELKKLGADTYIIKKGDRYEVNDMVAQLKLYQHWTTRIVYRSAEALQEGYRQLGMAIVQTYEWDIADENIIKGILTTPQFRDRLKRFCDLKEKSALTDNEWQELESLMKRDPILEQGYQQLGLSQLRRTRTKKAIKALIE